MGLNWIYVNNKVLVFITSTTLWPSSTKAEILAYLTALIVTLLKAKVTIFLDSKATIDGFNRLNDTLQLSVYKREKILNFTL